jgi:hypothetical protein
MADSQNDTGSAAAEGRRIYLGTTTMQPCVYHSQQLTECYAGNLSYTVSPEDIETVLTGNGLDNFQNIHISIDPVSGRNPGYCFVDFADRETAERALSSFTAVVNGRELKVGPCEPKKSRAKRHETAFQRWGDWRSGPTDENSEAESPSRQLNGERGPRAALNHFEEVLDGQNDNKRLYVGGLTKVLDQAENAEEMKELFQGFNPYVVALYTVHLCVCSWK